MENMEEIVRKIREKNLILMGNFKRICPSKEIMESLLKKEYSFQDISKELGVDITTIARWVKKMGLKPNYSNDMTDIKTREKIARTMRKHLNEHPEHYWYLQKYNKISIPCEYLKNKLKEKNIKFEEESRILKHLGYFYRGDIVFAEQGTIVEINGGQHYERRNPNKLTKYYQKRHDLLEQNGWRVIEIPAKNVYHKEFLDALLLVIFDKNHIKSPFLEYRKYYWEKPCRCGIMIKRQYHCCKKCFSIEKRICPTTKENFHYLIWNYGINRTRSYLHTSIAIMKKWISDMEFKELPTHKYWRRIYSGTITDYQI